MSRRPLGHRIGGLLYAAACRIDTIRHWRIGRHGAFLLTFGVIYLALGYSYTGDRPTDDTRRALRVALEVLPLWAWGIGWMLGGAFALLAGLLRPHRSFGWVALVLPALGWAFWYFVAWREHDTTRGPVSFTVYLAFAIAVMIVAGMVDPHAVTSTQNRRRRRNPFRRCP
ncbi:hypothetical protein [uncultured Jatrophihabitans sp.]|uniref:hypothetical protein n=1 Tax=uncultured Jatrophihabitans sp. TaxID=1610747 RepID=UPI0035CBDD74